MILEGTVTNVAAFGAFVDVGVHQDGLVHVSALANKFVSDPREIVKSGQVVRVKVLEADPERKRISLTLRLDDEPGTAGGSGSRGGGRDRGPRGAERGERRPAAPQPGQGAKAVPAKGAPARKAVPAKAAPQAPVNTAMAEALRRAGLGK